ncbi:DMP19 family protein, partial [Proteus mirabilis]|uniref:DMP19 family protein n=2 Tax=Gammaproteobacteria TaxID=1236 RepID=UPI00106F5E03
MTDAFASLRVTDVAFDDDFILLTLADGRRTRQPLRWVPALFEADAGQRARWVATADGLGVNWPALLPAREAGVVDILNQVWEDRYEAALARLKAAAWTLDALSDEDQQLVALWRMEADINNGGFMQFLCNWGDPTCQLALRALQAMGAAKTHAILAGMRGLVDRLEDDPAVKQ